MLNVELLSVNIASTREKRSLSQQQLAQKTGLALSSISKLEQARIKSPSLDSIIRISQALNVPLDSLIDAPEAQTTPTSKKIQFVYFDVNGVLVRFFQRAFSVLAKQAKTTSQEIETIFWHYNDPVNRGEISLSEFNKILSSELKTNSIDWKQLYIDAVVPIKPSFDLISRLDREGYKLGLLSNTMPEMLSELIKVGDIPDIDYQAIVDSSECGLVKPEPGIFKLAQNMAKYSGADILFIDDSRDNLVAAQKLGWRVVWFDEYRPLETTLKIKQMLDLSPI